MSSGPIPPKQPLPSLQQLRDGIPKHCFQRSAWRSMMFAVRDLAMMGALAYLAVRFIGFQLNIFTIPLWILYAYLQGTIGFGLFVVGHECGHGAFSESEVLNDVVGFILHSLILVPYFSWKRSHYVHHSKNNHILDNESHQPFLFSKYKDQYEHNYRRFGELGIILIQLISHSPTGWIAYLFFHISGSRRNPFTKEQYKSPPNHFSPLPSNEVFPPELRFWVGLSTVGVLAVLGGLTVLGFKYGFVEVVLLYGSMHLVTFGWLVIVTWLQHTEPSVPHLGESQWNWLKGAVLTVDRNYPTWIDEIQHHIGTTHVLHHIFPEIPHYKAVEATKSLKKVLGNHYLYDSTPICSAILKVARECHYVQGLEGTQYYRSYFEDVKKIEYKSE